MKMKLEFKRKTRNMKRNNNGLVTSSNTVSKHTNNTSLNIATDNAAKLGIEDEVNFLINHKNEKVCVGFMKKNGESRWISFVPNQGGKNTGNGIVNSKAEQGMITVSEILKKKDDQGKEVESYQYRTVNLTSVIEQFVVDPKKEVA